VRQLQSSHRSGRGINHLGAFVADRLGASLDHLSPEPRGDCAGGRPGFGGEPARADRAEALDNVDSAAAGELALGAEAADAAFGDGPDLVAGGGVELAGDDAFGTEFAQDAGDVGGLAFE
jgi:hypothetical protein